MLYSTSITEELPSAEAKTIPSNYKLILKSLPQSLVEILVH